MDEASVQLGKLQAQVEQLQREAASTRSWTYIGVVLGGTGIFLAILVAGVVSAQWAVVSKQGELISSLQEKFLTLAEHLAR